MIKMTMPLKGNESIIDIIKDAHRNSECIYITVKDKKYNAIPIKIVSRRNDKEEFTYDFEFNDYLMERRNHDL